MERYVLPNHYIFQIAERPPADMAALIGMFQSVPPVIKRRAKELFDVIKDCMKKYDAQTKINTVVEVLPSTTVEEDIGDSEDVDKNSRPANASASGLWSNSEFFFASKSSHVTKSVFVVLIYIRYTNRKCGCFFVFTLWNHSAF